MPSPSDSAAAADPIGSVPVSSDAGRRSIGLAVRRWWWALAVAFVAGGLVLVPVADQIDRHFSSNAFCAGTCHEMRSTVAQELAQSKHGQTATGVRPGCADCHVSRRLTFAMWDHFLGLKELYVHLTTDFADPAAFERVRPEIADNVRFAMLSNDSRACRNCHQMEGIVPKRARGKNAHDLALKDGRTCIACHYNLVHKEVPLSAAFGKAIGESR